MTKKKFGGAAVATVLGLSLLAPAVVFADVENTATGDWAGLAEQLDKEAAEKAKAKSFEGAAATHGKAVEAYDKANNALADADKKLDLEKKNAEENSGLEDTAEGQWADVKADEMAKAEAKHAKAKKDHAEAMKVWEAHKANLKAISEDAKPATTENKTAETQTTENKTAETQTTENKTADAKAQAEAKAAKKSALPKTADVVSVATAVSTAIAGAGALIAGRRQ